MALNGCLGSTNGNVRNAETTGDLLGEYLEVRQTLQVNSRGGASDVDDSPSTKKTKLSPDAEGIQQHFGRKYDKWVEDATPPVGNGWVRLKEPGRAVRALQPHLFLLVLIIITRLDRCRYCRK